jgi:hypothetical protein
MRRTLRVVPRSLLVYVTHDDDNFDPVLATSSTEAARRLAAALKPGIAAFRKRIDSPDTEPR